MTSLPEVLYHGSVKDVRGVRGEAPYVFEFSDRYSIFDWGVMPDDLRNKGASLAFMAWFCFDFLGNAKNWADWKAPKGFGTSAVLKDLRASGAQHHCQGLVSHDLQVLTLEREILAPSCCMAVIPVDVIAPECRQEKGRVVWDYKAYEMKPENALVPLEVVFRFGVPKGSSLLERTSDAAYRESIGLNAVPKEGDVFETPVIEFSTKLETSDRYIDYKAAQKMGALSDKEFSALKDLAALLALRLKDCFSEIDVELWDGKFEFAFGTKGKGDERSFLLVDSIGPDEMRLIRDGVHLSKELLRAVYEKSAWRSAVDQAKSLADVRGESDWKRICVEELKYVPALLSPRVKEKVEMVYMGLCRALSEKFYGQTIFSKARSLDDVVKSFQPKPDQEVA